MKIPINNPNISYRVNNNNNNNNVIQYNTIHFILYYIIR